MRRWLLSIAVVPAALAIGCQLFTGVSDLDVVVVGTGGAAASSSVAGDCPPGTMIDCYDGMLTTRDVGVCHGGKALCDAFGNAGACLGEVEPLPENCVTPADEDCDGKVASCSGAPVFASTLGGAGTDEARAIAVDDSGDVVVVGSFSGSVVFGATTLTAKGARDIFVLKLSAKGDVIFAESFGGPTDQIATSVDLARTGDIVVGGEFWGTIDFGFGEHMSAGGSDAFLLYLGPTGTPGGDTIPQATAGDDTVAGVGVSFGLNVYVAGDVTSNGQRDIWVSEYPFMIGQSQWAGVFGDGADQHATSLAVDKRLGGTAALAVAGVNAGMMAFNTKVVTSTDKDGFIVLLNQDSGGAYWVRSYGGKGVDDAGIFSVAFAGDELGVVGGFAQTISFDASHSVSATSPSDFFVALIDHKQGDAIWALDAAVTGAVTPTSIAGDGAANLVLGGQVAGSAMLGGAPLVTAAGPPTGFVAKLDGTTGERVWTQMIAGDAATTIDAVACTVTQGAVAAAGGLQGTATLGATPLVSNGGEDALIFELSP